jgi:hypothetical protein
VATDTQMTQVRNVVQNPKTTVKQMGVILADFISREAGRRCKDGEHKVEHAASVVLEVLSAADNDLLGRGLCPLNAELRLDALVAKDAVESTRGNLYDNAHDCGYDGDREPESEDERMGKEQYDAAEAPDVGNTTVAYHVGNALQSLMEDVQERLRQRFGLPAWNPLHECQDLIGDTDGLAPPDANPDRPADAHPADWRPNV